MSNFMLILKISVFLNKILLNHNVRFLDYFKDNLQVQENNVFLTMNTPEYGY